MVLLTIIKFSASRRIPLIRFRKGGNVYESSASNDLSSSASQQLTKSIFTGQVIEDWQLPERYRRKPIDQKEMDYINRGGPE